MEEVDKPNQDIQRKEIPVEKCTPTLEIELEMLSGNLSRLSMNNEKLSSVKAKLMGHTSNDEEVEKEAYGEQPDNFVQLLRHINERFEFLNDRYFAQLDDLNRLI